MMNKHVIMATQELWRQQAEAARQEAENLPFGKRREALSEKLGGCEPLPKSINGYPRPSCSRRIKWVFNLIVRAEQAGPFLPRERDQWPSRRRQPLPLCCGLGPRQFPQQPTRTISTYGRRCLAPARIQSLGILSSWRGSHLRGWDGRRLHRHIVDIQSPSNQHHAGKQYCQHCGEQLVDLVHYASPNSAGYFANPTKRCPVD
jgi:hypothetical protein